MLKILSFLFIMTLFSCATNRMHFANYTDANHIKKVQSFKNIVEPNAKIIIEEGCSNDQSVGEFSRCVWHAGYAESTWPMEGYAQIPGLNINQFLQDSLPVTSLKEAVILNVNKIMLKTWIRDGKNYRACYVDIQYEINGKSESISNTIKLEDSQTKFDHYSAIKYTPGKVDVVKLALRANAIEFLSTINPK